MNRLPDIHIFNIFINYTIQLPAEVGSRSALDNVNAMLTTSQAFKQ